MASENVVISIAGLAVRLRMEDSRMADRLKRRYEPYLRNGVRGCLSVTCRFSDTLMPGPEIAEWRREANGTWMIRSRGLEAGGDTLRGTLRARRSIYAVDSFLRVLLAQLAVGRGGMCMHAAAVARGKEGIVFPGVSGCGKTTLMRLVRDAFPVNDELCILLPDTSGDFRLWGTPFWGELRSGPAYNHSFRLAAVLYPAKGGTHGTLERITPKSALTRLLRCACVFSEDPDAAERVLESSARLLSRIAYGELHFTKNALHWNMLRTFGGGGA